MAVWFTESFRGQVLWDLARLECLDESAWREAAGLTDVVFTGGTLKATGEHPEVTYPSGAARELALLRDKRGKEFARIFYRTLRADRPVPTKAVRNGKLTQTLLSTKPNLICGLKAVYSLYLDLDASSAEWGNEELSRSASWISTFVEHALRTQVAPMHTNAATLEDAAKRIDPAALREATRWQIIAERVRNMITLRHKGKYREAMKSEARPLNAALDDGLDFPDDWVVHFDGWVTYVSTERCEKNTFYCLSTADLDRIQQMCVSRSMYEIHGATWCLTDGNSVGDYRRAAREMMTILREGIERCIDGDPNVLCRDLRKHFNAYLSMAAGSLADVGTMAMMKEIRVEKYDRYIDSGRFLRCLRKAPFDLAQDIGRIYKLLPAPDYDIGESFVYRQKQHYSTNPNVPIAGENPCNLEEFRLYMRRLVARTLARQNHNRGVGTYVGEREPRWFKEYKEKGVLPEDLALMDEISFRGCAPYVERHEESVVSWKDSAACEDTVDETMEQKDSNDPKRNMLLRFLFDPTCPTAARARSGIASRPHPHRAGFKMESHKTVSRIFFIGNMPDRLVQSEMEENVHRVALHCPGYMIGQPPEFATNKVMSMVAPDLRDDEELFFLNFDISAWSPGMRGDIQKVSHGIWAEVFDRSEFLSGRHINEGATVILNKRGYEGAYINPEANFEGYNGKEMTFMHCALMGYSVFRYRRASGHKFAVPLAAYIDDGLATFKDKKEHRGARFIEFARTVEKTYQSLGFLLEVSKCFLSRHFAIFLNEIYLGGRHITYGLRAIMRVGTKSFEPTDTLCARVNGYFSGAQGAMKAGMDVVPSLVTFLWCVARQLRRSGVERFMDARAGVLYLYTPRALGGLGCPNFMGMSSNLVGDGLTEGIATIRDMARAYPPYRAKVISLLRQLVAERTNTAILLSGSSVADAIAPMSETRLRVAIANAMRKRSLANSARSFLRIADSLDLEKFANALLAESATVAPAILDGVINATPYAILMSLVRKFESARTMSFLLGKREMTRVVKSNAREAILSMSVFRSR